MQRNNKTSVFGIIITIILLIILVFVSNIKIENNRLIYSLNTFNGKSTEEVKDHIYKVYSSSSIFEY